MKYVLILILYTGYRNTSPTVTSIHFETLQACQNAGEKAIVSANNLIDNNWRSRATYTCNQIN